jgi:hypothetical protein
MFSAIHNIWNSDGSGGDGRGYLIASEAFDDGQIHFRALTSGVAPM